MKWKIIFKQHLKVRYSAKKTTKQKKNKKKTETVVIYTLQVLILLIS